MSIGEKIKTRRKELGWSQELLAEKMGYTSKSTITRIEKGYNDVSQKNIAKFAEILNVSIAYLMEWDTSNLKYDVNVDLNDTNLTVENFSSKFSKLSDSNRENVLRYIDFLASQEHQDDVPQITE